MISVELKGGIGNMLLQIATIEYMGKLFNEDVCYSNIEEQFKHIVAVYDWEQHAYEYLDIFPNMDWKKNQEKKSLIVRKRNVGFRYEEITPVNGTNYDGYFQSEKNFPNRAFIQNLFEPSDVLKNRIKEYDHLFGGHTTCSIHVRRGNYLQLQHVHPVQPIEYYQKAMEHLKPFNIDRYIVFSNDIAWCNENFVGDEFVFVEDVDYIELLLMSICNHNIISNSAFAWWGAWLPDQTGRVVIAPNNWFTNNNPDATDVVPSYWIKY